MKKLICHLTSFLLRMYQCTPSTPSIPNTLRRAEGSGIATIVRAKVAVVATDRIVRASAASRVTTVGRACVAVVAIDRRARLATTASAGLASVARVSVVTLRVAGAAGIGVKELGNGIPIERQGALRHRFGRRSCAQVLELTTTLG